MGNPLAKARMSCAAACRAVASAALFALVYFGACWLRFEGDLGAAARYLSVSTFVGVTCLKVVVFAYFQIYQSWSRYVTFYDLTALIKAATASSFAILLANFLLSPGLATPRSVFLLDWGMTIVALGGVRSLGRLVGERGLSSWIRCQDAPALIVGANDSGEALLRAIRRNRQLTYHVVGFISDAGQTSVTHIGGVPVIGHLPQTCELARKHGVADIFITAGELAGQQVRELVDRTREAGINVRVLPSYEQLLSGRVNLRPREVSIEDLLRRPPVRLNLAELHRWIEDRVLLVTGSAGSIGSEICRQLLQFSPRRLVLVDRSENGQFFLERELRRLAPDLDICVCIGDVTDRARIRSLFETHRPDVVFHAAAYKHVPLMESHPGEAVKNIVLATQSLANEAEASGASSFVMISTDKAVNPTSVMGVCKRVAELYIQAKAATSRCQFVTVRFGNVLDSAGSVVPLFRQQIAEGGPLTVTHPEMTRYFMTIPEASQLVIQAGAMGRGGEIFVLDMGEPVKIVDLARDMIRLSGLDLGKDIDIRFVGQRPGEKLFEELNCDGERHLATAHPKIMVAESAEANLAVLQRALQRIERIVDGARSPIIAALCELVPRYTPGEPVRLTVVGGAAPPSGSKRVRAAAGSEGRRDIIPFAELVDSRTQGERKIA